MVIKRAVPVVGLVLMTLGGFGCDWINGLPPDQSYREKIVLNGTLIAGTLIDSSALTATIRLHRSADITEPYNDLSVTLDGATVTLTEGDSSYALLAYREAPGLWYHPTLLIQAGLTYSILVTTERHDPVTATTTVPSALAITDIMVDGEVRDSIGTIVYKPANGDSVTLFRPTQFTFRIVPDEALNPPAMARLVLTARNAEEPTMITDDDELRAFFIKWQGIPADSVAQRIRRGRSVSLNSINYGEEFIVGWSLLRFYGQQNLSIFAMDQAYLDYHKGNIEGLPSDPNYLPNSNVIGGYGLFSSANLGTGPSRSSMDWRLLRPGSGEGGSP